MLSPAFRLLAQFGEARPDFSPRRFGLLSACDGGLLEVSGLSVPIGTQCRIAHGAGSLAAEVIGFRNGNTLMMLLGDAVLLRPGSRVRPEGRPGMLPVGEAFLGRAVDGEGKPIDGGPEIEASREWPSGGVRAGALDRSPVRLSFDTGVRALNALTTFGVGQRIGVMAGSGVGKSVLLDMIAHGAEAEIVIVGLIGERAREVSDFVERHMHGSKRARTVVVAVPADHAPNLRIRGAMLDELREIGAFARRIGEAIAVRLAMAGATIAERKAEGLLPEQDGSRVPLDAPEVRFLAGLGFGFYLDRFSNAYASTYGGLATAMVFLVFLYWLAAMFLFGGEINGTAIAARRSQLQARMRARQAAAMQPGMPVPSLLRGPRLRPQASG